MAVPALPGTLGHPLGAGAPTAPMGGHASVVAPPTSLAAPPHLSVAGQDPSANLPLVPIPHNQIPAVPLRAPSSTSAPANPTSAAPHPAVPRPNGATGTVTGTVLDSITGAAVVGAQVEFSPLGSRCPLTNCSPVLTNAFGKFSFVSSPGYNVIFVTQSYYAQNTSYVDVVASTVTNIGTIYLVHDGYVSGTIENTAHQPLAGINVSSSSLNGTEFAFPNQVTGSNGVFTNVPVLPVPSTVSYAPTALYSRYQGNFTWVSVKPYQSVNLGVLYLDAGILVEAQLVTSLAGHPGLTLGQFAAARACGTYTGCVYQQGNVVPQAGRSAPTNIYFDAVAGPNQVTIEADGYVVNITQVTFPATAPNKVYNMGLVYMVPVSEIAVNVGFTWAKQVASEWAKFGTNFEGGTPMYVVSTSSIDGVEMGALQCTLSGCNETKTSTSDSCNVIGGGTTFVLATPLRVAVNVVPDTASTCNGLYPTWPQTYSLPVFDNNTFANLTPDYVTPIGALNLTPGVFIEGTVTGNPTNWGVQACSTDEAGASGTTCGAATQASNIVEEIDYAYVTPYDPPGCPQGPYIFCVGAPVGPVRLSFTATYAVQNYTWGYVTPGVFPASEMPLSTFTPNHISSVHMLQTSIKGVVLDAQTHKAITALVSLLAQPAGGAAFPASGGAVNYSGTFFLNTTPGWDRVTVNAPLYEPNITWSEVNRSTENVGTINLTEDGFIHGFVDNPQGAGIQLATVQYCAVSQPMSCKQLGLSGLTSTDGEYFGQVAPGLLPLGVYRIVVAAPGYDENSTWVNVTTPGMAFNASTLVLYPTGSAPAAAPHAPTAHGSTSAWVTGRVIDNSTKLGLTAGVLSVQANSVNGPVVSVLRLNGAGYYNISLTPGAWWINASALPYFYPASIFVNVSSNGSTVFAPTLAMAPLPWVHGRVFISPWESITTDLGMGPGEGTARTCSATGFCGSTGELNSGGFYAETAVPGQYEKVLASGRGTATGQPTGGFLTNNSVIVTVSNATLNQTPYIGLGIFGTVAGLVRDGSTDNASPVRYGTATINVVGPGATPYTVGETLNGGGEYIAFLPQNNKTTVRANGEAFTQQMVSDSGFGVGGLAIENNSSLAHFGWVVLAVNDSAGVGDADGVGRGRVGLAQVTANVTDPLGNQSYAYSNVADSFGLDNISAPFGSRVTVNVQAPDFAGSTFIVSVNQSQTTYYNDTASNPYTGVGVLTLTGWSWLQGHVVDPARDNLSIPNTDVLLTNGTGVHNDGPVTSNYAGYFLTDVPLGSSVNVSFNAPGYAENKTNYTILRGITGTLSPINLTGAGIVAGYVYSYPTLAPVVGALVSICPRGVPGCPNPTTVTNGSGDFWTIAPAGNDALNVTDTNYVPSTPTFITVKPDSWNWIGAINLSEFAFIFGVVRGLPSGDLLAGANLSLCFPNTLGGGPIGGCLTTVTSDAQGKFFLPAAAGTYVIDANATNYNDTYYPIALSSGEYVNINTIFLQEYGFEDGRVLGQDTQAPVPATTIQACPDWTPGVCGTIHRTDPTGSFRLSAPPGPYALFAIAPGYQAAYLATTFVSGVTVQLPPIYLVPTGTNQLYPVTGTVTTTAGFPVAGAIVSAGTTFATATDANGSFALSVPWGTYTVEAVAPGYLAASQTVVVHSPVADVNLTLQPTTFLLSGVVRDGLTQQPLEQVTLSEVLGGVPTTIAQTDGSGTYSVPLENGSHTIEVTGGPSVGGVYAPVNFTISVNGGPVVHNVLLFPWVTIVYGLVADAVSGVPIQNATIVGSGLTTEHIAVSFAYSSTASGTFQIQLYWGSYTITASAAGYETVKTTITTTGDRAGQLTVSLVPSPPATGTGGSGPSFSTGTVALLGGVAAAAVAAMLLARRLSAAPASGRRRGAEEGS